MYTLHHVKNRDTERSMCVQFIPLRFRLSPALSRCGGSKRSFVLFQPLMASKFGTIFSETGFVEANISPNGSPKKRWEHNALSTSSTFLNSKFYHWINLQKLGYPKWVQPSAGSILSSPNGWYPNNWAQVVTNKTSDSPIQLVLSFGTNLISSSKGISADFTSMTSQKRAAQCGKVWRFDPRNSNTPPDCVELDTSHFWEYLLIIIVIANLALFCAFLGSFVLKPKVAVRDKSHDWWTQKFHLVQRHQDNIMTASWPSFQRLRMRMS